MTATSTRRSLFWLAGVLGVVVIGALLIIGSLSASASPLGPGARAASAASNGRLASMEGAGPQSPLQTDTPTDTATPCASDYIFTQTANATMVPGTTYVAGSSCDDCAVRITIPFTYTVYGRGYTGVTLTANGQLVFGSPVDPAFTNECLPDVYSNYAIFAFWSDIVMDPTLGDCSAYASGCGAFTSVSGSAPNRIFNIEWRGFSFRTPQPLINFEVRLFEGQQSFEMIYAAVDSRNSNVATIGIQMDTGSDFVQWQCPDSPGNIVPGTDISVTYGSLCGTTATPTSAPATDTPTPPPTSTPTMTASSTPTVTPDLTATNTPTNTPTSTGTSTPTSTPADTFTPTSTPTALPVIVVGRFTVQGRPTPPSTRLAIPLNGSFALQGGGASLDYSATADSTGSFTVTTNLPPGTYNWWLKNPQTLANGGSTLLLPGINLVDMGQLREGDANNDNCVRVTDFNIMKLAYGRSCGDPSFDARADFNGDCTITISDFNLLKVNYSACGAPPITPPTPTASPTAASTSTPTSVPTSTPTDTATNTPTSTSTDTPTNTSTSTPTSTPTNTPTNTPTATPTNTPTNTPTPTDTPTDTPSPTNTPTNTPTPTDTPTDTPTATFTATPTATPEALLIGHVTLQGRPAQPSPRQSVPITLSLRSTLGTGYEFSSTTDQYGFFTVTAAAPGVYDYRVKNPQTLANGGQVTLVSGENQVEMGQLREGDANNDNCVRVTDFNIVKLAYGRSCGDPSFDARADFNGDCTITISDFNLLKVNYSACGVGPVSPGAPNPANGPSGAVQQQPAGSAEQPEFLEECFTVPQAAQGLHVRDRELWADRSKMG